MKAPFTLTLTAIALLASCSTPKGISIRQYAVMNRGTPATTAPMSLRMSAKGPMAARTDYPPHTLEFGKEFHILAQRDFVYPSSYGSGKVSADLAAFDPGTPGDFKTTKTGMDAALTARRQGSLIVIEGTISITEFQGFSRMGGALGQPILDSKERVIYENRVEMPRFATYTTPVFVAIEPAGSSSFEISAPRQGTRVTLSLSASAGN